MGQTLSEPIVEKYTSAGGDDRLIYGASAMQGWRITMEDAHTTLLKLEAEDSSGNPVKSSDKPIAFFAVYDGHGGQKTAKFSGAHLHRIIARTAEFKTGDFHVALKKGFLDTDVELKNDQNSAREASGCTAVTAIITENKIYVGNAGDSRAVVSTKGVAEPLSIDHKPGNATENARIIAAGGFVEFGRVNGNLALSRALGDFDYKQSANLSAEQQIVTADPEVKEHDLVDTDEFMVLACDGIWDCMSNQDVVDFVSLQIADRVELGEVCERLMDRCLAPDSDMCGLGCDNMTVVIVGFLHGRTKEKWQEDISNRIAHQGGITLRSVNHGASAGSAALGQVVLAENSN